MNRFDPGDVFERFVGIVRTAYGDADRFVGFVAQRQPGRIAPDLRQVEQRFVVGLYVGFQVASGSFQREVNFMDIRNVDHPDVRFVVVHQRDVDGEFSVAFQKFLGAVQRVDHPKQIPVAPLFVQQVAPLFAQ